MDDPRTPPSPGPPGLFVGPGRDGQVVRTHAIARPAWLWILVLLLAALAAWVQHLPHPPPVPGQATVAPASSEELMRPVAKLIVAAPTLPSDPQTAAKISEMMVGVAEEQLRPMAAAAVDQMRLAIVLDALGATGDAQTQLDSITFAAGDDQSRADAEVIARLFRGEPVADAHAVALKSRHAWFADLVLTRDLPPSDPAREAVTRAGVPLLLVVVIAVCVFVTLLLTGIVLWIVALSLAGSGRIRAASPQPLLHGPIGLEMVALFFAAFLLMQLVGSSLARTIGTATGAAPETIMTLLQWSLVLALLWPIVRGVPGGEARRALGHHSGRGVFREVSVGILGYIAGLPLLAFGAIISMIASFIHQLLTNPGGTPDPAGFASHPVIERASHASPAMLITIALLAVIWAPVVEETIFRGALFPELRRKVGWLLAALVTGVIFAIVHPIPWLMLTPWVMLGIHFSLLRHWRGSLIAPMTAHFLQNAGAVTMIALFFKLG